MRRLLTIILLLTFKAAISQAISLSDNCWQLMLDREAEWRSDRLYLPKDLPSDLASLPYNPPTGGWASLRGEVGGVSLPMTIDEHLLGGVNTASYEGVSWAWRSFVAPKGIGDKLVFLNVSKARMRAEVFINEQLVAYDVVGETPFSFEVGRFIKGGEENRIAVRLTNPGGRRGWRDDSGLFWGESCFASGGRNFTTLGEMELEVKPRLYIDDIFVKNILPVNGREVEVSIEVNNTTGKSQRVKIPIEVRAAEGGERIATARIDKEANVGRNTFKIKMLLTGAKLWSPDTPNLYSLTAKLGSDTESVRFGVRTFELKAGKSGGHNYYLNGKRFIFKTAIDWNYYAPTGDYATEELARKSVLAAKAMGQNGISCHRNIGEPLLFSAADELGLCIYEEQGGFHVVKGKRPMKIDTVGFTPDHLLEKIRRMVVRDRNHPSMIIFSLSNEDNVYHKVRREALQLINSLDDSKLIINTSGPWRDEEIAHIRPYESEIRMDYLDRHTAYNRSPRYGDDDFYQPEHREVMYDDRPYFLGEVNSVSGPENWFQTYRDIEASGRVGYDTNIYKTNHDKTVENFERWNVSRVGREEHRVIHSPEDLSQQCGRGMMYAHSRHAQSIMCNNSADGYALNGWTPGPQSEGSALDWSSGILDEGRNIKAPVESYTYWARPLQVALARKNGKYFGVNEEVTFEANLINHGLLPSGEYTLSYSITDGEGRDVAKLKSQKVRVEGGECYAQELGDVTFTTAESWAAGYVTISAKLQSGERVVADGSEQILLRNRASYSSEFKDLAVDVRQWDEAHEALEQAGATVESTKKGRAKVIVVGDLTREDGKMSTKKINSMEQLESLLKEVREGATLIVRFDRYWADALYHSGVLSERVTEWGGNQTTEWLGNGWGYLSHFVGYRSTANEGAIGTTSWEVPSDPYGFYPFVSDYKMGVYGVYMCREWLCRVPAIGYRMKELEPTMAVLLATLDYGDGRIILNPCYHVDDDSAFADLLFYGMVRGGERTPF